MTLSHISGVFGMLSHDWFLQEKFLELRQKFQGRVCATIAGCSSMGGVRTEHSDVLSDSTTELKTMVLLEGSAPEPCPVHFSSECQSKCGNTKQGQREWEVEQGL